MEETNTVPESTISEEQTLRETAGEAEDNSVSAPQETETEAAGADASGENDGTGSGEAPFLEIKYNHEKRGLTRAEAVSLAQKALHYEGAYKELERNAALEGKTVDGFLKSLDEARDKAYRDSLAARFGDDEDTINQMMELYAINKQKKLDEAEKAAIAARESEEQSLNERLADEFIAMKTDFPELTDFASLPKSVKQAAADGMPLPYAYLQFKHNEAKKAEAAKASAQSAAEKSAGSMNANDTESLSEEEKRYLEGLRSAFNI